MLDGGTEARERVANVLDKGVLTLRVDFSSGRAACRLLLEAG
jgi:hypothetical protein